MQDNSIALRQAAPSDSEFVYLVKKAALGEYIALTWGWDEAFQRDFHEKDYDSERTQIIVYKGDDAGWLLVNESETDIHLQEVYLRPEYQNLGIGSTIVRSLLAEAARANRRLKLQVLKVNTRARKLYKRLGLQVIGEDENYYLMST
jgi:ribosomal protein S18 acetylase RimI-like enzyme